MSISSADALQALSTVIDPDFKKDLVTLKMIEDLKITGNSVSFTIVLTTPACPMKSQLENDSLQALQKKFGEDIDVKINFSSRVTSRRTNEPVLPGVKNIIAIASGKGGVGKSTVTINLALALSGFGAKVGVIDADIFGPSLPMMMGLEGARPSVFQEDGKTWLSPVEKLGLKLLSIGFLVDTSQPVVWRGPMASSALRQFITDCKWGDLDYLLIDLPPGTSDIHLTLVQTVPLTGAVIVTTPQEIALTDARKAAAMFMMPNINVPLLGVVENMSWFEPAELPGHRYHLFGKGGGKTLADECRVQLLGEIPLIQSVREAEDAGEPEKLKNLGPLTAAFQSVAENLARQVSIRNAEKEPTKVVDIVR